MPEMIAMEKSDTVEGTISRISSELKEMAAAILLYDDLKHDSFNRLLTRIEQAIDDEQSAWKETAADLSAGTQAEPAAAVDAEADKRQTRRHEIGTALERLVG